MCCINEICCKLIIIQSILTDINDLLSFIKLRHCFSLVWLGSPSHHHGVTVDMEEDTGDMVAGEEEDGGMDANVDQLRTKELPL